MTIAAFTDLAACELCLVPDAGIGLSGSNLITWSDQSGKVRDASVANAVTDGFAAATGPVYSASDVDFANAPSVTYGGATTSCLATPLFTVIPPPLTFIIAGRDQSALNTLARVAFDRLALAAAATRWSLFRGAGSTTSPNDSLLVGPYASSAPVASAARRVAAANLRGKFVVALIYRSATFGGLVHNGIVRAFRAMPQSGTPTGFAGMRIGRDTGNVAGGNGQEWTGQLSLCVAYSRELSMSEIKDAMLLARTKCGITWATARAAA